MAGRTQLFNSSLRSDNRRSARPFLPATQRFLKRKQPNSIAGLTTSRWRWNERLKKWIGKSGKPAGQRSAALTLEEKLAGQKQIRTLEAQRNNRRRALFDAQDDIDRQRETLIAQIEERLQQAVQTEQLFSVQWRLT